MTKNHIFLLLLLSLLFSQCSRKAIHKSDIKASQKLTGVEFSDQEIETMLDYIKGNRKAYDSMRSSRLPDTYYPAVSFDPRPAFFKMREATLPSDWKLRDEVMLPESDEEIAFLPVMDLGVLIRTGKLSSTRLTRIYLERLKKYKDTLYAVVSITEDLALAQAAKADEELKRGIYHSPLHGIPYGIKDLFAVPGYKTTWGAEPYRDQVRKEKAAVAEKLELAGAVLVAKLTTGALARGDVWFGGKTRNPWDLNQGASGSSAGSASATAAGLVAFSIGTETLGSIIAPSTRCGVTGLRPTFGSVSRAGVMTLSWSMDKAGPICRTALDCALVFNTIKGPEISGAKDHAVIDYPFSFHPKHDLKDYKIGYFKKLFDKDTTAAGSNSMKSLTFMKELGAELHEVALPDSIPYGVFDIILRAEAGAFFDELVRSHNERRMSEQGKDSRANSLRQSRFISAVEYLQANRYRQVLIEKFNQIISGYDFLVAPTMGKNISMATNITGHPAVSVPNGFDKKGRPTSFTLIGNLYDEGPILEAAYLIQQLTDFEEKHPARFLGKRKS